MNQKNIIRVTVGAFFTIFLILFVADRILSRDYEKATSKTEPNNPGIDYNNLEFKGLTAHRYPIHYKFTFEYSLSDYQQQEFTIRESWDQALDWMFLGILTDIGLTQDEYDVVTKDIPAVRYGILSKLLTYDYGPTRSKVVGEGTVVALIPRSDSLTRIDHLAHIADEERKNMGQIPDSIWVFEYEIDSPCSVNYWRMPSLSGKEVFSPKYGYHEEHVTDIQSLRKFMDKIDDLTYANGEGKHLKLGGRKIFASKYWGAGIEEIATIWQAESEIQSTRTSSLEKLADRLSQQIVLNGTETEDEIQKKVEEELLKIKNPMEFRVQDGTGFSLDPVIDHKSLAQDLEEMESFFKPNSQIALQAGIALENSSQNIPKRIWGLCKGLHELGDSYSNWLADSVFSKIVGYPLSLEDLEFDWASILGVAKNRDEILIEMLTELQSPENLSADYDKAIASLNAQVPDEIPFFNLLSKIKNRRSRLSTLKEDFLEEPLETNTYQMARYDGNLGGTAVGMHYFSTDLKAKLYTIDYLNSAPKVSGFRHDLNVNPPWHSKVEEDKYNGIRTWFGLRDDRRSFGSKDSEVFYARNAARIFSASSSTLNPGEEVEGSSGLEAPNLWWNAHYEEVANEDTEYQLLNELLKWSDLAVWMLESKRESRLKFLSTFPVERGLWFWDWAKSRKDLHFQQWDSAGPLPRGYKGQKHECMTRLSSRPFERLGESLQMHGGVSAASRDAIRLAPRLSRNTRPYIRRATINYAELGANRIGLAGGKAIEFIQRNGKNITRYAWKEPYKFRNGFAELSKEAWERTVSHSPRLTTIELGTEDAARLGTVRIQHSSKGLNVSFNPAQLEESMSLGSHLAMTDDPVRLLKSYKATGKVDDFLWSGKEGEYLIRLPDDEKWTHLILKKEPTLELESNFKMRASGPTEHSYVASIRRITTEDAQKLAQEGNYILPPIQKSPIRIRNTLADGDHWPAIISRLREIDEAENLANGAPRLLDEFLAQYSSLVPHLQESPLIQWRKIIYETNSILEREAIDLSNLVAKGNSSVGTMVDNVLTTIRNRTTVFGKGNSPNVIVSKFTDELGAPIPNEYLDFAYYQIRSENTLLIVDDIPNLSAMDWQNPFDHNFTTLLKSPKKPVLYKISPQPLSNFELRLKPSTELSSPTAVSFSPKDPFRLEIRPFIGKKVPPMRTKDGFNIRRVPPPRIPIYYLTLINREDCYN